MTRTSVKTNVEIEISPKLLKLLAKIFLELSDAEQGEFFCELAKEVGEDLDLFEIQMKYAGDYMNKSARSVTEIMYKQTRSE